MQFEWDPAKSEKLKAQRGVSFEEIVAALAAGKLLIEIENPAHPGQRILIVRMAGDVWAVVSETRGNRPRLVTAYRSRKWRKKYGP